MTESLKVGESQTCQYPQSGQSPYISMSYERITDINPDININPLIPCKINELAPDRGFKSGFPDI